nr:6K2 [Caladenia virus A]
GSPEQYFDERFMGQNGQSQLGKHLAIAACLACIVGVASYYFISRSYAIEYE